MLWRCQDTTRPIRVVYLIPVVLQILAARLIPVDLSIRADHLIHVVCLTLVGHSIHGIPHVICTAYPVDTWCAPIPE